MKNIEQSLKRNGPLDAQGIEMRLVDCRKGGGGGGGGGGGRGCCLLQSGPIQNAFVGSIALGRQLITSPSSHIKMDYLTCYTAHNRV